MALTDNLNAYYKFDEASGNAVDATVNANDMTGSNAPGTAAGVIGTSRTFSRASSQNFSIASNSSLLLGDIDFTYSAWVYLTALDSVTGIINKGNDASGSAANNAFGLAFNDDYTNHFELEISNGSTMTTLDASSFGSCTTGTWYFVVVWHDSVNNIAGISVNDVADTVSYSAGVVDSSSFPLQYAKAFGSPRYLTGRLDEAGFWKRVLTSGERTSLYNSGAGLAYPFSGGSGNITAWITA